MCPGRCRRRARSWSRSRRPGSTPARARSVRACCARCGPPRSRPGRAVTWRGSWPETGPGVTGFSAGDEVIGWTDNRASQAEYVLVEAGHLTAKPAGVPWEVAGALFVAGATAYATVRAVALTPGDTVVVAGAAGGVGTIAVQLARRAGATVIGLASEPHHAWLTAHGVIPVSYGDGVADRIRQAAGSGQRVHRHGRQGLCPAGRGGSGRAALPGGHHRQLRGRQEVRGQGRGQRRRVQSPRYWPSWPA